MSKCILQGQQSLPFSFLSPFNAGPFLKERICSYGSKFFPFRKDPSKWGFSDRVEANTKPSKLSPFEK